MRKVVPKTLFPTGLFHQRKCPATYFAQAAESLSRCYCSCLLLQAFWLRIPRLYLPFLCPDHRVPSPAVNRKLPSVLESCRSDSRRPSNADCATTWACCFREIRP